MEKEKTKKEKRVMRSQALYVNNDNKLTGVSHEGRL
jgi:hypothetical protein